jgi:hypothetical protein
MAEQARMTSIEPQQRGNLPEFSWHDLSEPGAYVAGAYRLNARSSHCMSLTTTLPGSVEGSRSSSATLRSIT